MKSGIHYFNHKSFNSPALLISVVFLFFQSACNEPASEEKPISKSELNETLIDANVQALRTEEQQIQDFLDRYKWQINETRSGLKYLIYEKGRGEKASEGRFVTLEYTVSLLNGNEIYSSEELGTMEFVAGKGGVESGLEEGILFLHQGDRAKFILPSHLAFGLTGDKDRIPPKTTIIYDVKLLKVQ